MESLRLFRQLARRRILDVWTSIPGLALPCHLFGWACPLIPFGHAFALRSPLWRAPLSLALGRAFGGWSFRPWVTKQVQESSFGPSLRSGRVFFRAVPVPARHRAVRFGPCLSPPAIPARHRAVRAARSGRACSRLFVRACPRLRARLGRGA